MLLAGFLPFRFKIFKKQKNISRIFLIGFMGAGKTSIGKYLAEMLGYKFVDTDQLVREAAGKAIPEIFKQDGEEKFRELEANALESVIKERDIVVATGGGIPTNKKLANLMFKNGLVIALLAKPEILYQRIKNDKGRPLLKNHEYFIELYNKRARYYLMADLSENVESRSVDEIVKSILKNLKKLN